ncbi:MAG: sugar O-acetyltransferase [Candidatus Hodarchaeota archaeon]
MVNPEKTEKQKMIDGELYNSGESSLMRDRYKARQVLRKFNGTSEKDYSLTELYEIRTKILTNFLGKLGNNCWIEPPFYCDYGYNIFLDEGVYMNFNCTILDPNKVHIGKKVQIGSNVQIITATHPLDAELRTSGPELAYEISIGDQVWIGSGAIILPGVTIGADSTIGAGSVVTKNIPSRVVAAGNPCQIIKNL